MSQVIVDDQDPAVVHNGVWAKGGTANENAGTVSSSTRPGDSLSFQFTGTQIAVYGTIDDTSKGVTTTYAVDGASGDQVVSPAGSGDTYKQLFWKSDVLSSGSHSLTITMDKVNTGAGDGEGTVWFDYLQYTGTPSSTATSSTASISFTTGSGATPTQAPAASSTSTTTSSRSGNNIGTIVGAVVGVVLGLLIIAGLIAFVVFRRRRKGRRGGANLHAEGAEKPPFSSYGSSHPELGYPIQNSTQPAASHAGMNAAYYGQGGHAASAGYPVAPAFVPPNAYLAGTPLQDASSTAGNNGSNYVEVLGDRKRPLETVLSYNGEASASGSRSQGTQDDAPPSYNG